MSIICKRGPRDRKRAIVFLVACTACALSGNAYAAESSDRSGLLPDRRCVLVHIDDLYRDYAEYSGERVCTIGHVHGDVGGVSLWPYDKTLTLDHLKSIELDIRYGDFDSAGLKSGSEFFIEGEFSYNEKCFKKNSDGKHETICAPLQYPMYLEDITLSRLTKVWP